MILSLEVTGLCKTYPKKDGAIRALRDISFSAAPGEFLSLVGKSGSGKTTLLRLLGNLEKPSAGNIIARGRGTTSPRIGMVFQEPRLLPWKTVEENLRMAMLHHDKARQEELLAKTLRQIQMESWKSAYPSQLSGGMAQRVALGRTLCYEPDIILMDEPLSALDYFTRQSLQNTIEELYVEERKTILFVTHHVEEALRMGGRVLVLREGSLQGDLSVPYSYPRKGLSLSLEPLRRDILHLLQPSEACSA